MLVTTDGRYINIADCEWTMLSFFFYSAVINKDTFEVISGNDSSLI